MNKVYVAIDLKSLNILRRIRNTDMIMIGFLYIREDL